MPPFKMKIHPQLFGSLRAGHPDSKYFGSRSPLIALTDKYFFTAILSCAAQTTRETFPTARTVSTFSVIKKILQRKNYNLR